MPVKAFIIAAGILAMAGCAQWPSQTHQTVTLDEIRDLLNELHQEPAPIPVASPPVSGSCNELAAVQQQMANQQELLTDLNQHVYRLTTANPTFSSAMCPPQVTNQYDGKMVVGSIEWVYLPQPNHHYKARVDSGATTSSIHAENITRFERDGKKWVSFELRDEETSEVSVIEVPLLRTVAIRQASSQEADRRNVVKLTVNIGNIQQDSEFTLTNRAQMDYAVLLGRNFLQDIVLIDVGQQLLQPKFQPKPLDIPAVKNVEADRANTTDEDKPKVKAKSKPVTSKAEPSVDTKVENKKAGPKKIEPAAKPTTETKTEPVAEPKIEPVVEAVEAPVVNTESEPETTPEIAPNPEAENAVPAPL